MIPAPGEGSKRDRFYELDSLRGLAALTVVFAHYFLLSPLIIAALKQESDSVELNLFIYSPLRLLWAGGEAVFFFFILSGFVLSLPFLENKSPSYISFVIKRVCRIYIPYYAAIIIGALAKINFYSGDLQGLSSWFNRFWKLNLTGNSFIDHLVLLGNFDTDVIDPVIWSLVHEMRISLIFPVIMYFVVRFDWKINFVVAVGLSLAAKMVIFSQVKGFIQWGIDTRTLMTIQYIFMFVVGALLAKHRQELKNYYDKLASRTKWLVVCFGLALYMPEWLPLGWLARFNDYFTVLGVGIILIVSLSSQRGKIFLLSKPIILLGKISYSLYLYHFIILLTCFYLWYGLIPIWLVLLVSFLVMIAASVVNYYIIERPSIAAGKVIAHRICRAAAASYGSKSFK